MPRSDVITVAELLGRNPGSTPHAPAGPREIPRQVRKEPWLTRTNKTSAAITFGSVLAVGTTLAVGSTLLPHSRQAEQTTTPATAGPISDSSSITPHEPVGEHVTPAPSGLTGPDATGSSPRTAPSGPGPAEQEPAAPFVRIPTQGGTRNDPSIRSGQLGAGHAPVQGSARVPSQGSTRVPAQGRHAASVPRGPHLDSRGNPLPTAGSSGVGRHRDPERQPSTSRRDNSGTTIPGPTISGPSDSGSSNSGPTISDRGGRDHNGPYRNGPRHSGSDHSDGGLLGGTLGDALNGLSIGPL